jgi:hypothetical protein
MKTAFCKYSVFLLLLLFVMISCEKETESFRENTPLLSIDSLVASKTNVEVWEEVFITAYTKGDNLSFAWSTNHGSMAGVDSATVKYWGCPSCTGNNTVLCTVTNIHGSVRDTIIITVNE